MPRRPSASFPPPAALAAAVGDPRMNFANLVGSYENLPLYDPDRSLDLVLSTHPEVRAAQVGVERAQAAIRRAKAEVIPNLNVYTGYIRQYENQSHDFAIGVNGYIPVWNRNQGNIRAAQAELGVASQEVGRVQNDLTDRVATAYRLYAAARRAPRSTARTPRWRRACSSSAARRRGCTCTIRS